MEHILDKLFDNYKCKSSESRVCEGRMCTHIGTDYGAIYKLI